MKRTVLLLFIVLSCFSLRADEFSENYGNGVVHIIPDSMHSIYFYSAPDSPVTHDLHFQPGAWSIHAYYPLFDGNATLPAWFQTVFLIAAPMSEYQRVDIVALDSSKGYYRTILKDDAGREVWVKKESNVTFLTWFGFYAQMAGIEMSNDTLILFEKPEMKAKRINYTTMYGSEAHYTMRPLRMNGYWMEVEVTYITNDPVMDIKKYTGWILWRNDKRPLITYNLMGC